MSKMVDLCRLLRNRATASMLDPLVTSGTMFLVQATVLLTDSKAAFASYSLAYSYVVMGQAVLSALFGGPLITLLGSMADEQTRAQTGTAALRLQLGIAVGVAAMGIVVAVTIGLPTMIAAFAALGIVGLSFRDALRNVLTAQLRLGTALANAIWFAGATAAVLGGLWLATGKVTALGGLAALAIGALGTLVGWIASALRTPARLPREALHRLIGMAVWSVPGAAVIWLQNSFYLTLVAVNLSLNAVGEVSAARMIVMPILITASGLLRLAQVQASRKLADEGLGGAISNARRLALACLAAGAGAGGACWAGSVVVDPEWLPHTYPHLLPLAATWLLFAAATMARGFYSSLFQAMARYREIFVLNIVILPFVLGGVVVGPGALGLPGAVLPMAAGELVLLALLAARARR